MPATPTTLRQPWRRAAQLLWAGALLAGALLAAPVRAENAYVMDLNLRGIYSVDVLTGGPATLLTPITPPANAQGYTLATRPSDGMLFYLDSSGANPNLWRWNPATPTVAPVLVGTTGAGTTDVVRLGFDSADNLIAMDTTTNMWTLDTGTGGILGTTPLSGDKPSASGDLCLNTSTGVLYMVANQNVYTVTGTGVSTLLGTVTGLGVTGVNGYITGCAFARDGSMLVSLYSGGNLRKVNLSTLAATALPNSTGMAQIGDLSTAPQRSADLRLAKTASNPTAGTTTSFTVTLTNEGPVTATDVRVLDALPAGLVLTSVTASQGSYSAAASGNYPAGTWRLGVVPVGATATLVMTVNITAAAAVTNTAQISYADQYDPDSTPNNGLAAEDDQAAVAITPSPDLQLAKTANTSFAVGVNGGYTITVNNAGRAATSGNYSVTDVLPAGLAFVSATGTGWACGNAAGTVTCTSSTVIAAGGSNPNPITLTVLPSAPAAPSVSNTASVAGGGEPGSNNGNNTSTVTTAVCNANCPDLRVNKTAGAASFTVGSAASYTLSVTNIGGTASSAPYTLDDPLPAGLTLSAVPTAGAGWNCPASGATNSVGGNLVSCTRANPLASNAASTTIGVSVNVLAAAVPQVVNTATVSGGGEPAATQGNNSTSVTTPVTDFDLTISKLAGSLAVAATSTYTFTVANIGGRATAGSYSFSDDLPAGITLRNSTGGTGWVIGAGWSCALNGDQAGANAAGNSHVYCTSATAIAAGASSATVVVPVTVAAAAAPSVTNTVNVAGAQEAPALKGNNAFSLTTPVSAPDLAISKSHSGSFSVGGNEQYTITVTNIGGQASAGNIVVVDTLPAGLTYGSAAGAGWTCSFAAPNVTCTRSTALAAFTSAGPIVITVTPTAAAAAASPVVNTATVSGGNEPAGNSGNNSASDPTGVYYPPVLAKSFSPASIPAGGTSTLTLTITNANPAGSGVSLQGLALTDPFPAGMSVAAAPNLVNTCGGALGAGYSQGDTLLSLSGGATGGPGTSCQLQVRVTAAGVATLTNTTGQVSSTNSGIGATASATLTTTAGAAPILTKVTSPGTIGIGETSVLTFTITNKSTASTDLRFTDTLPPNVTAVGATFGGTCTSTGGTALGRTVGSAGGRATITVAGVDLGANLSCTVSIPVTSGIAGSYVNDSTNIGNLLGGLTAATLSDTLVVQPATLTKSFTPAAILVNGTATMALVLTNSTEAPEHNGMGFRETLPPGLVLAQAPTASQCGGSVVAAAGGNTVTVSGATLAAGLASCTITAVVTAASSGSYTNAAANVTNVTSNLVNSVNAALTVSLPLPTLDKTNNQASISPGSSTTYVITVGNSTGSSFAGGTAVVLRDPAVANLSVTGAVCAAQGGASCPAASGAAMIAALQSGAGLTVPSLPNNGTVTFSLQAQLTGNPAGTLTNVVTATVAGSTATAQDSDAIVYPALVNTKMVAVISDPVNGTSNPKAIPGAVAIYTIQVGNQGVGAVDANSLYLIDTIPANTELFVGDLGAPSGPIGFSASTAPPAGVTWSHDGSAGDDVDFSSSAVPGPYLWTYTPVPNAQGYDAAVTAIRLNPKGTLAGAAAAPYPQFQLQFKVRIK